MKKNKVVITAIVSALVVALLSTAYFLFVSRCTLDGDSVCFDKETQSFKVEEDADLLVQVENEEMGTYLEETWDKLHPENKGAIHTTVQAPLSIKELSEGFPYDVMITNQNNASYFLNDLRDLGDDAGDVVGSRIPSQLQDAINLQGYYFVQNSIDGWYFVYNETLLKEMGFNMKSETGYGLPTALDSWEKIFENSEKILEKSKYVFPLTFADQLSFYPFLTGGRWTLNFTHRGSYPGFESREFHEGLELIEMFGKNEYFREEKVAETTLIKDENKEEIKDDVKEELTDKKMLPWLYEEAFYNRETPFTIMHKSLQFEAHEELSDDVYKIAPFPRFEDHHLAPMGEVNGYMVDKSVPYPSASAEVIRILRTPEALVNYKSADDKTLVYSRSYFDELDLEDEKMRDILAYNYHDTPSVLALDNNPNKLTRSLYDEVEFMDLFKELYLGKLSSEEVQAEIVKRVNDWIDENDGFLDDAVKPAIIEGGTKQ